MRLVFTPHGWEDYSFWMGADRATLKRINRLIGDDDDHPAGQIPLQLTASKQIG